MASLPVDAIPIPTTAITTAARRHDIDDTELGTHLAAIYTDLLDETDAITTYYDTPTPLETADGLGTFVFITPPVWTQLPTTIPTAFHDPIQTVYTIIARDRDAPESHLARYDLVLTPPPDISALYQAGLSERQAMVQHLRTNGYTQTAIADTLGIATNTVKVHCHRIDQKISAATHLLDLVDP